MVYAFGLWILIIIFHSKRGNDMVLATFICWWFFLPFLLDGRKKNRWMKMEKKKCEISKPAKRKCRNRRIMFKAKRWLCIYFIFHFTVLVSHVLFGNSEPTTIRTTCEWNKKYNWNPWKYVASMSQKKKYRKNVTFQQVEKRKKEEKNVFENLPLSVWGSKRIGIRLMKIRR